MKRIIYLIFLLLTTGNVIAQNFRMGLNAGYGLYQLTDIKDLQTNLREYAYPLPVETVEKFPGYYNYSTYLEYCFKGRHSAGINGAFYSTGGRNHLKDYSGEYKLDMLIKGYRYGVQYRYILSKLNKISLYAQLKSGIILSTLKIDEYFVLHKIDSISNNYTFKSINYFDEPSAGIIYKLGESFSVDFCFGYQIDFQSTLHEKGNEDNLLYQPSGDKVYINWSGIRLTLGISFSLK